jgi:lysozyme family protein
MTPNQAKIYQAYWDTMVPNNNDIGAINEAARKISSLATICRYEEVAKETAIPGPLIGCIHMRESSFNWNRHLANGDPLTADTIHVPANIMAPLPPPYTWEEAAIAALNSFTKRWGIEPMGYKFDIPGSLWFLTAWNGFGYDEMKAPNPYLWAMTNLYTGGLFVADDKYDPNVEDRNCGCAPVLKVLGYQGLL